MFASDCIFLLFYSKSVKRHGGGRGLGTNEGNYQPFISWRSGPFACSANLPPSSSLPFCVVCCLWRTVLWNPDAWPKQSGCLVTWIYNCLPELAVLHPNKLLKASCCFFHYRVCCVFRITLHFGEETPPQTEVAFYFDYTRYYVIMYFNLQLNLQNLQLKVVPEFSFVCL